jgi:hypothetical protein
MLALISILIVAVLLVRAQRDRPSDRRIEERDYDFRWLPLWVAGVACAVTAIAIR